MFCRLAHKTYPKTRRLGPYDMRQASHEHVQLQASAQNENLTPSLTKAPSPDLPLLFEIRY
jgi:hypothetical protein